jgi:hypothetical protein
MLDDDYTVPERPEPKSWLFVDVRCDKQVDGLLGDEIRMRLTVGPLRSDKIT